MLIQRYDIGRQSEAAAPAARHNTAIWSIGIYSGETPFHLQPCPDARNPVLSAQSVTDIRAEFVADPFMIRMDTAWHMFFEVMNAETGRGEIGWATSDNGLKWAYQGIVLREPFHLSYPCVISAGGEYYMIPESYKAGVTTLYRGDPFPKRWYPVRSIMEGRWVDSTPFVFGGMWWMFSCPVDSKSSNLDLFFSESLYGPWSKHPNSPLIEGNNRISRPGGRTIVLDDRVIRFCQDCHPRYGTSVRAFEVYELTTSSYREREIDSSPILVGGSGDWNMSGMHHIDPQRIADGWIACVDGFFLQD